MLRLLLGVLLGLHFVLALWLGRPEPGPTRWWDERFNVRNVESILAAGRIQPANGYYGGVSYLPQTAALAIAQRLHVMAGWSPEVVNPAGHLTPPGYHLIRASQALWGTFALFLLYLLARRLIRPEGALLAAVLMAICPRLYHASAIFKPDVELAATTLLALLLGWRAAVNPPRTWRYLAAGAAIGLAVGAKLNGVVVAFPFVLATVLRYREWSRWPRLALAGVTSFVVFWAFNPSLSRVLRSLEKNRAHYEHTATGGFWEVLRETLSYPFRGNFHGPWITTLALLGMVAVASWLCRPAPPSSASPGVREQRVAWWMLLSYPLVYYLFYAVASPRAKANHFLQIVPFVALFAAVALVAVGARVSRSGARFGGAWGRLAFAIALVVLIAAPAHSTFGWIYVQVVPSTWDQAQLWVERRLPKPRGAFRVATVGGVRRGRSPRSPTYSRVATANISLGDFDALIGPRGEALLVAGGPEPWLDTDMPRREFRPGWFKARDEALIAAVRPRALVPHPAAGRLPFKRDDEGRLVAALPPTLGDAVISIRIRLRIRDLRVPHLRLHSGAETHRLVLGPASRGDVFLISPRFPAPADGRLVLTIEERNLQSVAKGELFVWGDP